MLHQKNLKLFSIDQMIQIFYNDEEFAIYEDNTDTDGNVKFRTGMEESNLDQMYDVEKLSQIDGF